MLVNIFNEKQRTKRLKNEVINKPTTNETTKKPIHHLLLFTINDSPK
jgi:hypothetical protein